MFEIKPVCIPEDIERLIFEAAAEDSKNCALTLIRVARHIHRWIEPYIYRNISFHRGDVSTVLAFLRVLERKPLSFLAAHVKSLSLPIGVHHDPRVGGCISKILAACPSITDLACWILPNEVISLFPPQTAPLPIISSPHNIRRLSGHILIFTGLYNKSFSDLFCLPQFSQLTHLFIADSRKVWASWSWDVVTDLLPALTHFALNVYPELPAPGVHVPWLGEDDIALIACQVLKGCPRLCVCVFPITWMAVSVQTGWFCVRWSDEYDEAIHRIGGGDPRLVGLSSIGHEGECEGPKRHRRDPEREADLWVRAEEKVQRQRILWAHDSSLAQA